MYDLEFRKTMDYRPEDYFEQQCRCRCCPDPDDWDPKPVPLNLEDTNTMDYGLADTTDLSFDLAI